MHFFELPIIFAENNTITKFSKYIKQQHQKKKKNIEKKSS